MRAPGIHSQYAVNLGQDLWDASAHMNFALRAHPAACACVAALRCLRARIMVNPMATTGFSVLVFGTMERARYGRVALYTQEQNDQFQL